MNDLVNRLKVGLSQRLLNVKNDKLDIHYMTSSQGSFTRRELANEINNETEVGIRHLEMIIELAVDLVERKKEKI